MDAETDESIKEHVRVQQKQHHDAADQAYSEKKSDKENSKNSIIHKMYTFDLQQCLPTPYLRNGDFFYKRSLWTFNFTIHDCDSNNPYCYMWHEGLAGRGGNEIASCIFDFLSKVPSEVKHVTFYSDCCPGQNRNSYLSAMFKLFLQSSTNIDTIDHKFLIPGHTHMECDSDHAVIEKKKKVTSLKIHYPRDWFQFVRSVGGKRNFQVIEMTQENFLDFGYFAKNRLNFRQKNTEGKSN